MKLKIAYVISGLGRGGAERQLQLLLRYLDRDAFAPTVVSLSPPGPFAEGIRDVGVSVFAVSRRGRLDVARLWDLVSVVRGLAPDVLQTFLLPDTIYGFTAGRLAGVPVLIASRRTDRYEEFPPLVRALNELVSRWADAVICNSRRATHYLPAFLAPRAVVIHNGVEPLVMRRTRDETRAALGIPADALVVGTVGRLVPAKNPRRFLAVATRMRNLRPDLSFLVVGGGPLEREIRAEVDANGLAGRVVFTGERDDIADLLGAMDIFLLTSDREGLPNAVMEAMAAGLPCVVTDVGGNAELVVDGETGFVRRATAIGELANAAWRLAEAPGLRRRFGDAGRRRMRVEFTPEALARQTEILYRSLASRSARRSREAARPLAAAGARESTR